MGAGSSREAHLNSFRSLTTETVPFSSDLWKTILSQNLEDDDSYLENFKKLKNERPENLATFIKKLIEQLVLVKGKQRESNTAGDFQLTSISLSYLSRILPIIFESSDKDDDFVDRLLWLNQEIEPLSHPTTEISTLPIITTTNDITKEDIDNIVKEPNTTSVSAVVVPLGENNKEQVIAVVKSVTTSSTTTTTTTTSSNSNDESSLDTTPLAVKLMDSLLDLLFFPGFTVSESLGLKNPRESSPDFIPQLFSWTGGFGVETVPTVQSKQQWINRLSVLQCLIACLSQQLYVTQDSVASFKCKWLDWITGTQDYYTETLLFSLINTFSTYDPIGYGVPYNYLMYSDDHEKCSKLSIQILNILLSYDPDILIDNNLIDQSPTTNISTNNTANTNTTTTTNNNKFINYIKTFKRARDFKFFFNSFERIMNIPLIASHSKLPNSTKKVELHQDLLVTFWRFITYNHEFLRYIVNYENSPEFLIPMLQYMDEGRKNKTNHGIVQIGTFILLVLSGERDFSISLNKPFVGRIHIDIQQPNVYSDFVINVMYRLLVDTPDRLESIFECVLTILTNLSPYMKNLSMVTCVKLMKLFEYLSSPRFLFATNHNYRYVGFLLESLNNLLQHQYESNTRLIYAILRCQNQFSKLAYLKISPITPIQNTTGGESGSSQIPPVNKSISNIESISQPSPVTTAEEALSKINKLAITEEKSTTTKDDELIEPTTGGDHQDDGDKKLKTDQSTSTEHPNSKSNTPTIIKTSYSSTPSNQSPRGDSDVNGVNADNIEKLSLESPGTTTTTTATNKQQLPPGPPQATKKTPMYSQFMPTDEWLQDIKRQLPLDNILKVITHLSPQIQGLCSGSGSDEQKIMDYLKMSTIVGIFHNPGPIMTRRYHSNTITKSWFIAYMWCIIYLENHSPPLFLHTDIKLFQVKQ